MAKNGWLILNDFEVCIWCETPKLQTINLYELASTLPETNSLHARPWK